MRKRFRPMALMKAKGGLSHIPSLNGAELPKLTHTLIHDTRSEFSKNVRTYNLAVNASMNKYLSQTLREVHTKIEGLNRSQQATYSTMCKIVEIQRRAARETYKKFQQDPQQHKQSRETIEHVQMKRKVPHKLSPLNNSAPESSPPQESQNREQVTLITDNKGKSGSSSDSELSNNHLLPSSNSRSLPQTNDHPLPPKCPSQKLENLEQSSLNDVMTLKLKSKSEATENDRSRSNGDSALESVSQQQKYPSFSKKAFFTASLRPTLPPIVEAGDDTGMSMAEKESETEFSLYNARLRKMSNATLTESGRRSSILSPIGSTDDTVVSARMATALRSRIASLERDHMEEFLRKQNLDTKPKPYELPIIPEDEGADVQETEKPLEMTPEKIEPKVNRSIAAERRKLAKLRTLHRKTVLNSEDIYVYVQQPDGTFRPEGNSYKRKRFLPPSNREEMERRQIIKKLQEQMEAHDNRIGKFFDKINIPLEKKLPNPTVNPKSPDSNTSTRPPPVEPVETKTQATKPIAENTSTVAYVREYIRPADRSQFTAKVTSWQQNY